MADRIVPADLEQTILAIDDPAWFDVALACASTEEFPSATGL